MYSNYNCILAMIFSMHSTLWKVSFKIIMSKMCTYSHVMLEVIKIKIPRKTFAAFSFTVIIKVGFRWFLDGFWMFSFNIKSNYVKFLKKMMYLPSISYWYLSEN